jgi:hypothetical protein
VKTRKFPLATMITKPLKTKKMKTLRTIKTTILVLAIMALPHLATAQEVTQVRETGSFQPSMPAVFLKLSLVREISIW